MATFSERMIGAAKLDVGTYEEVEHDSTALGQAVGVVVLSSIASGIGAAGFIRSSAGDVISGAVVNLALWFLWAGITYVVGTKMFPTTSTQASWGELLRTTGFSAAPGVLRVLGILPLVGGPVFAVTYIWMLMTFVVAIRQALDYTSTGRAVAVCLVGWVIYGVFHLVLL